jgi:tetratricopeptide (TPR) repeat protein
VALLPVSQIRYHHELVAEHFLYVPLMGLAVPLAAGLARLWRRPAWGRLARVAVLAVAAAFVLRVGSRNADFASEQAFAQAVLREYPRSLRGHLTLGHAQASRGDLEGAAESFGWVVAQAPPGHRDRERAQTSLLTALAALGRLDEAEHQAFVLLQASPEQAYALRILGTLRVRQGRVAKGLVYLERAAALAPDDPEGRLHLGMVLLRLGRLTEAAPQLEYAATAWRWNADAQLEWARLAWLQGDWEAARQRLWRVLTLAPDRLEAASGLVQLELAQGRLEQACATYAQLLPLRPALAEAGFPCGPPAPPEGL